MCRAPSSDPYVTIRSNNDLINVAAATRPKHARCTDTNSTRTHTLESVLVLVQGSELCKRPLARAGLQNFEGLHIFEIERADGTIIPEPSSDTMLYANDIVKLSGSVCGIARRHRKCAMRCQ